jgi:hypothetical protein
MIAISHQPLRTVEFFLPYLRREGALPRSAATLLIFSAFLAWTYALHFPFRFVEGTDDAFFLEVAHLWTQGVLPYIGAFDIKPPGLFAILTAAEALLGSDLQTIHAVSIFFDSLSATALYFIGRRMGSRAVGVSSALIYPFLSLFLTNNSAYPPLEAFAILAFLAALSPLPIVWRTIFAGLSIGVAATIKQTAAVEGVALFTILLRAPDAAQVRSRVGVFFVLAAALAPLAVLLYFAAHDAAGAMIGDIVVQALKRPDSSIESISFSQGILRSVFFLPRPIGLIFVLACFSLLRRQVILIGAPNAEIEVLALWLTAAFVSIWAQHAIFRTYLAPALAPLTLLASASIVVAMPELRRVPVPVRCIGLGLITAISVIFAGKPGRDTVQESRAIDSVAQVIKATNPSPNDKLFVAGRGLRLYLETGLTPPTAYFHWEHTLCNFPGAGPTRLAEALAATPRYFVVSERRYMCGMSKSWGAIDETVARSYRLLIHITGNEDFFDVYEAVGTKPEIYRLLAK